jgi:hypothetical protein
MFEFCSLVVEPRFVRRRFFNNVRSADPNEIRTCRQDGCPQIAGAPLSAARGRKPIWLCQEFRLTCVECALTQNCGRKPSEMITYEILDLKRDYLVDTR